MRGRAATLPPRTCCLMGAASRQAGAHPLVLSSLVLSSLVLSSLVLSSLILGSLILHRGLVEADAGELAGEGLDVCPQGGDGGVLLCAEGRLLRVRVRVRGPPA